MADKYSLIDNGTHDPGEHAGENWQESFMLAWYDPATRCGAYHHIDFQIMRRRACIWSWIAVEGKVTSTYQAMTLPLEAYDMAQFTIGPIKVSTLVPLKTYAVTVEHPAPGNPNHAAEEVVFEAFTKPLYLTMNEAGEYDPDLADTGPSRYQQAAAGHYETLGRVDGWVAGADGRRIPIKAAHGFQDHSWGPRDYASLTAAHRWIFAVFGDDLCMDIYTIVSDPAADGSSVHHAGTHHYGYVWDRGSFQRIARCEVSVSVSHDGFTPTACDVRAWSVTGRGYHFEGRFPVSSVSTQFGNYFSTDALGEFRAGHRLGSGGMGLRNRHKPSPAQRAELARFDPNGLIGW